MSARRGEPWPADADPDDPNYGCGESYDHNTRDLYDGPDGVQWECIRCGAEGWEPKEEPDA